VEEISRRVVVDLLANRSEVRAIEEMPLNNPGYDLRVHTAGGVLYVEVKGTRGGQPKFFLSEGERLFGQSHPGAYLLAVVTGINLADGTWQRVLELAAAPSEVTGNLRATQWRGDLTDLSEWEPPVLRVTAAEPEPQSRT